jgi:hypothetical protein
MEPAEVQMNTIYTYKGQEYIVRAREGIKVKDPDSGNWHDGVIYSPTLRADEEPVNPPRVYVRQLTDFAQKFRPATEGDS